LKSRRTELAGNVAHIRELRNAHRIFIGKPEGKKQLVRPKRRWLNERIILRNSAGLN
jgi:hypothetical protein